MIGRVQSVVYSGWEKAFGGVDTSGRKCLSIMPKAVESCRARTAQGRHVRRRHQPRRRVTNTDQDGPQPTLRWPDACSYTIWTHYRQWDSGKAAGEHQVSPCRDNLRIVYASCQTRIRKKTRERNGGFFCSRWWWPGDQELLSQMHPIWRKRVLAISPSLVQCLFPQISHLVLTRNSAETSSTTPRP